MRQSDCLFCGDQRFSFCFPFSSEVGCTDPKIGSYNNYHLSPNGKPRGSQTWYGLVY